MKNLGINLLITLFMISGFACKPTPEQDILTSNNVTDAPASQKITLALNWFPEAEHGGFYTAQISGYFAEEGLEVEIIPGGPGVPVVTRVASGQVDFAVGNADQIILGRAQEAKVVALMTPLQKSPRCIMVHEESGIRSFDQLQNMTLAMNSGRSFAAFLQSKYPLTDVKIVPYAGNLTQFLLDKKFAVQGYTFSEPFTAKEQGATPHTLMLYDIGFNPYTSLLMTSEELLADQPELAEKMTRACIKGWQTYLKDPVATNQHLLKLNDQLSEAMLNFGTQAILPLTELPDEESVQFGQMTLKRWQTLVNQLEEAEVIKPSVVLAAECFQEAAD